MCRVRTRSKREASSQNLTRKTSHMLNIPYNFLNGFELISKMTRGTFQSAEIRRSAEKSHVWCMCVRMHAHMHPSPSPHTHTPTPTHVHVSVCKVYVCACLTFGACGLTPECCVRPDMGLQLLLDGGGVKVLWLRCLPVHPVQRGGDVHRLKYNTCQHCRHCWLCG